MKKMLTASAVAALALAISVPALAGGANCSGKSSSASSASYSAWSGAWLERSATGTVTVAEVAKGSPASKAGLKPGDVVLAVNGYNLSDSESRAMCASKASCTVGSTVAYTVSRAGSTKELKLKLAKMPASATDRYAGRDASFEPMYAAVVMPASAN